MSGARFGKAIAHIVAETLTAHNAATIPAKTAYEQKAQTAKFEGWEKELAPIVAKMLGPIKNMENLPEPIATMVQSATAPTHQVELAVLILAAIGLVTKAAGEIIQPFVQPIINRAWAAEPNAPLSPGAVAAMVTKGWLSVDAGIAEMGLSGLNSQRAGNMINVSGNAPGPFELLTALRRGIIGEQDFEHGIQEGLLRNEWINTIRALMYSPPTAAEAIQALVQGHVDQGTAQKWAAESGLDPKAFDALYQTAGMPLSPGEALDLFRRGEFTQSQVEQNIRESRIKNKYIPNVIQLARKLIPPRTVGAMVGHGILDEATGATYLQMYGYNAQDAAAVVKNARATKAHSTKELAKGEVVSAYENQLMSRDNALQSLIHLGYDNAESDLLLSLADHKRQQAILNQGIRVIGSRYVSRHISRSDAGIALDRLQVPTVAKDTLMTMWDLELSASPKMLSLAEIGTLGKKGLIDPPTFHDKVAALGYSEADIGLLALYYGVTL